MRRESMCRLLILVIIGVILTTVDGHVSLTFPRARKYALDFLDSARTPGPCGMPKGDEKTQLLAGSKFNITWHLAYPHKGGFKLQILDALDRPLVDLTPVTKQTEFVEGDATAQSYPVELPTNFTCTDCTVRLLREAEEWGSNYRFWSCADIDVIDRKTYREDCSGHGRYLLGRCRCDQFYHGARCEFKEDCLDDSDCGNQGFCIDNGGTTSPTKHCYCNVGWYGPGCNKRSTIKTPEIDLDGYTMKRFSDDFLFYWRIIRDTNELEGVMVVNSTSWVAVGWRPSNLTPACRAFPEIHDRITGEPLPQPEPKSDPIKASSKRTVGQTKIHSQFDTISGLQSRTLTVSTAGPQQLKSSARRRSAKQINAEIVTPRIGSDVTVQTSVTYKVSTKHGRKRRSSESATAEPIGEPNVSVPETSSYELDRLSEATSQLQHKFSTKNINEQQSTTNPLSNIDSNSKSIESEKIFTVEQTPEPKSQFKFSITESKSHSEPIAELKSEPYSEPNVESEPKSEPESIAEPKSEPESISEPKSEPESIAEPKSESKSEPESVSEPKSEPESIAEPKSEPESIAEPKSEPESIAEPKSEPESIAEPKSEPKSEPESVAEPKSEPESIAEPKSEPNSNPDSISNINSPFESSHVTQNVDPEVSVKSGASKAPIRPEVHKYTPKHDFNPMDCTDIVVGMANKNSHRIGDYYTRDRSTPQPDGFWGGKDSLTAAMGFEKDGVTTIVFRKPLTTNDFTDYNIVDGDMQVIWAKGQEPGKYIHQPPSGLERSKASVQNFYKQDELKYHGHRSQRGVVTLNFFDDKSKKEFGGHEPLVDGKHCGGEWKYPRNCSVKNSSCEYYIRWIYKMKNDQITFTIVTKNTDMWTGVGFSENDKMTQTDAVLGWVDKTNGRPFVMDTWINGYNAPLLDPSQDIFNASGKIENGMTSLTFSRKRITKDNRDFSFTDDHCLYMMFPVKGGIFNSVNKKIRKHTGVPIVSSERICIKSCGIDEDEEQETSTSSSLKYYYDIQVKLVNLGDGFKAPSPGTQDFDIISNRISDNFSPILINIPGYDTITVNELRGSSDNGVIAKMNLIVDKNEDKIDTLKGNDALLMIEGALRQALISGKVGSLTVDPQYFFIAPSRINAIDDDFYDGDGESKNILLSETKLYVIIGCVAALVALALLQASCTLYKTTRKKTTKQERLIASNGWRDYSAGAKTNFGFEGFETEEKTSPPPVSNLPGLRDTTSDRVITRSSGMMNPTEKNKFTNQQQMTTATPRATYSLPRAPGPRQQSPPPQLSYYTQDRRNNRPRSHGNNNSQISAAQQPDFYFMPSQRKYSGEVVRVYVDYGNQKSK